MEQREGRRLKTGGPLDLRSSRNGSALHFVTLTGALVPTNPLAAEAFADIECAPLAAFLVFQLKLPEHEVDEQVDELSKLPSTNACNCVSEALSLADTCIRTILDTTLPLVGEVTDTDGAVGAGVDVEVGVAVGADVGVAVGVGFDVGVAVGVGVGVRVAVIVGVGVGVATELLTVTPTTADVPWLPAAS